MLLLVLLFAGVLSASAQENIRGRVVDGSDGSPLVGVNVTVQSTTTGTITDLDGNYNLRVLPGAETLVFSFVGYETQEIAINGRNVINVTLEPVVLQGDELVVVGYTTEKRRNITGAVATVEPEALDIRKSATLEDQLKGRLAGVQINSTGEPGRGAEITIRGQRFLGGSGQPLYVVDGMYMSQNPNLNPNDIASIQVLKDASAAAQYGSQSANGVVVITTKRGNQAPGNTITFNTYAGYQEVPHQVDIMNSAEWAALNRMAYENVGLPPIAGAINPTVDTDWQDALFTRGSIQNHNLQISGATTNANYLISGGYTKQDGAIIETGFERYSLRVNSELQRGILTFGENASLSRANRDNLIGYPLIDAVRMLPTIPVYDPNNIGGFGVGSQANYTFATNPVGMQKLEENASTSNQALGTVYAEVALPLNLRYRFNLGLQYEDYQWGSFIRQGQIRLNDPLLPARLTKDNNDRTSVLYENLLTTDQTYGRHTVNAVVGLSEQKIDYEHLRAYRENFPNENYQAINAGTENLNNEGFNVTTTRRSYLARANYDFANRYLVTGTFRRDGSSRFGPGNRWGNFWSGSLGWVVSEESFYKNMGGLASAIPSLKLRGSYGELGNEEIDDYAFAALIYQNIGYLFGPGGGQVGNGAIQTNLSNPDIRWQDNRMTNIGVDLALLNYAVTLNADYYISESGGALVRAPLPWSLGSDVSPFVNAGTVRNSGFEVGGAYRMERKDFNLNTGLNLTTTKNEVLELGNGGQPIFAGPWGIARTTEGGPVGEYYVLKMEGIFQSQAEVDAHSYTDPQTGASKLIQPGAKPGDVRFADLNNDGIITDLDRYGAGNAIPDLELGFFADGRYKAFDFAVALRGTSGTRSSTSPSSGRSGWTTKRTTPPVSRRGRRKTRAPTRRAPSSALRARPTANPVSDRWIENGNYLRIQNVVLGLHPSGAVDAAAGVKRVRLRVYVNLQNLYTFTNYSSWDPGTWLGDPLARGIDDGYIYPNVRTISVGLDLRL